MNLTVYLMSLFSETWFTMEHVVYHMPEYKCYYLNRTGKQGSRVSMPISCDMDMNCENFRIFLLLMFMKHLCSSVVLIYFVFVIVCPAAIFWPFFFCLVSILDSVNKKCTIILGGDFNINLLADSSTKIDFEILLNSH